MVRSKELKDRLCKFKYNPYLKKTQLKSVSSLQRLEKIKERDFDEISNYSHQYSNNKSRTQESKSLVSRISKYTSSQNSESKVLSSNKSSFEKLMAQRNISKVKVHFGNEEFASRIKGKLDSLKKGNYSEMKRYRHPEPISSYWKSRCFTTQIESSN